MHLKPGHELEVEPGDTTHSVECECCGHVTQTVSGFIHYKEGATIASYCVRWTLGKPEHPPWFLLTIGPWGEGISGRDRVTVVSKMRIVDSVPNFMVIDAQEVEWRDELVFGTCLKRSQVIGEPVAETAFSLIDEIVIHDSRVRGMIECETMSESGQEFDS